jgi:hypothetical protein
VERANLVSEVIIFATLKHAKIAGLIRDDFCDSRVRRERTQNDSGGSDVLRLVAKWSDGEERSGRTFGCPYLADHLPRETRRLPKRQDERTVWPFSAFAGWALLTSFHLLLFLAVELLVLLLLAGQQDVRKGHLFRFVLDHSVRPAVAQGVPRALSSLVEHLVQCSLTL